MPIMAVALIMVGVFAYVLPLTKERLLAEKKTQCADTVGMAYSILDNINDRVANGELDIESGQKLAKEIIGDLRFGNDNDGYVWINDLEPKLLVHPLRPDYIGKNVSSIKDAYGKPLYGEFVRLALTYGEGFIYYDQILGNKTPRPKVSYIKLYKPWGWIIGSGVYVDDISMTVGDILKGIAILIIAVSVVVTATTFIIGGGFIYRPVSEYGRKMRNFMATISTGKGDLSDRLLVRGQDEIGMLAIDINRVLDAYEKLVEYMMNAPDVMVVLDVEGVIMYESPSCRKVFGYAGDALHGTRLFDHIHVDDVPKLRDAFASVMNNGNSPYSTEVCFMHKDGSWKAFRAVVSVSGSGNPVAIIVNARDITERKRSDSALAQKNRELAEAYSTLQNAQSQMLQQEKMASVGMLAAGVAHEINNPMGFILSNLNTLSKYTGRLNEFMTAQAAGISECSRRADVADVVGSIEEKRKALKIDFITRDITGLISESLDGANRVKNIVYDLKNFSRLDETEYKIGDINAGLESTINIVWNELKYKCNLVREYGEIPPTLCNMGQLNQVFMNLLVNASHAIDKYGEIRVKTWAEDSHIHIAISDTGCGISGENLKKIFDPFFTTKEVGKGTGLGLSITYDIIKKHQGAVNVSSEVGKGTTFTISLPIVPDRA